ncbi:mucin-19 isoform X3 [Strongylocentrotus purpuratus]|uniref:Hyalin n=1 Tax=Strongylocentrotus purpuratus TaxID=7668 RepID=A0A7M7PMT1_STRPU|nr:mucin-19 isoform X3 [Strongylocentrotus purpuratus]
MDFKSISRRLPLLASVLLGLVLHTVLSQTEGPQSLVFFNGTATVETNTIFSAQGQITLQFRTCTGGELFSQTNGDQTIAVSINETGSIRIRWNSGSGTKETAVGEGFNDNLWTIIDFVYVGNSLVLRVRDEAIELATFIKNPTLLDLALSPVMVLGTGFTGCMEEIVGIDFANAVSWSNARWGVCPLDQDIGCGPQDRPCAIQPCLNNGVCSSDGIGFTCQCTSRYSGTTCENDLGGDATPPVLSGCPGTIALQVPDGTPSAVATWTPPTATDSQGTASVLSNGNNPGSSYPVGSTTVIYTAKDEAGLQSKCAFNILVTSGGGGAVVDGIPPVLYNCTYAVFGQLINNSELVSVSWELPSATDDGVVIDFTIGLTFTSAFFPEGRTGPFSWRFSDAAGNEVTCELYIFAAVARTDTTPPSVTSCPGDVTAASSDGLPVPVTWTEPTASDGQTAVLTISSTRNTGDSFGVGTTPVRYIFIDDQANTANCDFNVIVTVGAVDTNPPVITGCPSTIVLSAPAGATSATATWIPPEASDAETSAETSVTIISDANPGISVPVGGNRLVTYTASDVNGLQAICSFNIIVSGTVGNQAPQLFNCPASASGVLIPPANSVAVFWTPPTATDDSGTPAITSTFQPGSQFFVGVTPVTYTARDAAGLATSCSFQVTVTQAVGNQAPQLFNCPASASGVLIPPANSVAVFWTPPTATDDSGTPAITSTFQPGSQFFVGVTPVTYTARDAAGLATSCSFQVTVTQAVGNQAPQLFNCPESASGVSIPPANSVAVSWTPPTATDDSGTPVLTSSFQPGSQFFVGVTPVTYTARDAAGLATSCSFQVTVTQAVGNQAPQLFNCPASASGVLIPPANSVAVSWTPPTATDDSGTPVLTSTIQPGSQFVVGVTPVTYSARDAAGLATSCSFQVTVTQAVGNQAPQLFNCPASASGVLIPPANSVAVSWTPPTATDDSGTPVLTSTIQPGSQFVVGVTPVTYSARDAAGLATSCSFQVTVTQAVGNQAPQLFNCPESASGVSIPPANSVAVSWTPPTATDDSGTPVLTSTIQPGSQFVVGVTPVTYSARDAAGLATSCSFQVTVTQAVGNQAPQLFNCPASASGVLIPPANSVAVSWTPPTATDDSGTPVLTSTIQPGSQFVVGVTPVTYSARDAAGLATSCSFQVTVTQAVGNQAPQLFNCPESASGVSIPPANSVAVSWTPPTATDDSGTPVLTSSFQPGSQFFVGVTPVTYTARDAAGLATSCSFQVTVTQAVGNQAPQLFNCPASASGVLIPPANSVAVSWTPPTATDDSGTPVLTSTIQPGSQFVVGVTPVTYSARDAAGLATSCSFQVTVTQAVGNQAPQLFNCPASASGVLIPPANSVAVSWTPPTATDDSGTPVLTSTIQPGSQFVVGVTPVTYSARDAAGLATSCSFQVTVTQAVGNQAPQLFNCPESASGVSIPPANSVAVSWTPPTATDDSGTPVLTSSFQPGSQFFVGVTPVTYTARDAAGLATSCSFQVTVTQAVGNQAPQLFNCPESASGVSIPPANSVAVSWTPPTATDDSGTPVLTSTIQPGSQFVVGVTPVTYSARDAAGLATSCSFQVTVTQAVGNQAPQLFNCPASASGVLIPPANSVAVSWTPPTATDDSGTPVLTSTFQPGSQFVVGVTPVTYSARDAAGLATSCSFQVTVTQAVGNQAPQLFNCPASASGVLIPPANSVAVSWTPPTATDDSGTPVLTSTIQPGSQFVVGVTPVTYSARDAAGLATSCSFQVTVTQAVGNQAPQLFNCPESASGVSIPPANSVAVSWTPPTATDDSGTPVLTSSFQPGSQFFVGVTPVTYTARDAAGLATSCSFQVTVTQAVGNQAPQLFNCPESASGVSIPPANSVAVSWTPPTATDDSGTPVLTSTFQPGSQFFVGVTPVTYTARDAAGLATSCSFQVTVTQAVGNQAPQLFNCPESASGVSIPPANSVAVSWTPPTATDDSGTPVLTSTFQPGSQFFVGVTPVTYTARDAAGLATSCSFQVTVTQGAVGNQAPQLFNCPASASGVLIPPANSVAVSWTPPTATDDSGTPVLTSTIQPGSQFVVGVTPVTYSARDAAGLATSCSFQVTVTQGDLCSNPSFALDCINGACMEDGESNTTFCRCATGYGGPACNTSSTLCDNNPCGASGECQTNAALDDIICHCSAGYGGTLCTLEIHDCEVNPCLNRGACQDGINSFTCDCTGTGYSGTRCETNVNECQNSPCQNGAGCSDTNGGYYCTCTAGNIGPNCEENLCSLTPCENGATCSVNEGNIICTCAGGFEGGRCETDIDECVSQPCQNGGICVDNPNEFQCFCAEDYIGIICEIELDECDQEDINSCLNGATCMDLPVGHSCNCIPGFTDADCGTNIDECASSPCSNNATCVDEVNQFRCECAPGFSGIKCEININECASNPCDNGGVCTDEVNGYACNCSDTGSDGPRCTDICSSNPCPGGADCLDRDDGYECKWRFPSNKS